MPWYAKLGILTVLWALFSDSPSWGLEPIWAKNAVRVQTSCDPATRIRIQSPDGTLVAEVSCEPRDRDGDRKVFLRISGLRGNARDVELPEGASELLWAPDSNSFFINGGKSGYAGFFVLVYDLRSDHVEGRDITSEAQKDMVAIFPPCKAANRTEEDCKRIEQNLQYNMSGLAWTRGSAAIVVFAEVPCSSSYGGIMCQVEGYELDVATGRILRRLTAREMKKEWQKAAAWEIRIPDPPTYGPPWIGK